MKKLFFVLTVLAFGIASVSAETFSFDWVKNTGELSAEADLLVIDTDYFTITLSKDSSTTAVANSYDQLRCYKNASLTFTAKEGVASIDAISFQINKGGLGDLTQAAIVPASAKATADADAKKITLTGNCTSVKYVLGAQVRFTNITFDYTKAAITKPTIEAAGTVDFGAVLSASALQTQKLAVKGYNLTEAPVASLISKSVFRVSGDLTKDGGELTISCVATENGEYSETLVLTAGEAMKEVTLKANILQAAGDGSQANPISVEDAIAINAIYADSVWVEGVIIGAVSSSGDLLTTVETQNTSLALSVSASETEEYLAIQLPKGEVRDGLDIFAHKELVGATVKVYGVLALYCNKPGVKGVTAYEVGTGTGLEQIQQNQPKARKIVENGQIYILKNGVKYNIFGAEVE